VSHVWSSVCPSLRLNISETTADRRLVTIGNLGAYKKKGGQNRLVMSLMTSRDPMHENEQISTVLIATICIMIR